MLFNLFHIHSYVKMPPVESEERGGNLSTTGAVNKLRMCGQICVGKINLNLDFRVHKCKVLSLAGRLLMSHASFEPAHLSK